jgi:hypothetical protein
VKSVNSDSNHFLFFYLTLGGRATIVALMRNPPQFLLGALIVVLVLPLASRGQGVPLRPLEGSELVVKGADGGLIVAKKDGSGIDGLKLSQHDRLIASPSIAVGSDGTIHVAFLEQHRTTYVNAIYHRSSSDGGKTWTEAKNLTEDSLNMDVGRCQVLVDKQNRVYVIWRAAVQGSFQVGSDLGGSPSSLWFRTLDGGKWSKAKPISEPGTGNTKYTDAAYSFFAAVDDAGRVQVVWNVVPDKWHAELLTANGHSNGVGDGLVMQSTLDGANASLPREVFLPVVTPPANAWAVPSCDGLDTLNGYVDAEGAAHFIALAAMPMYGAPPHPARYELIENGKAGESIQLPELSFHAAKDIPTLLLDAKGKRHVIALYLAGEHPNIRDYQLGSDDEPTVIRAAAGLNAIIDGFQAYQGPGGRMVAVMQMNDTGERSTDENYVSISTGDGKWSVPVNVSNNAGRKTYISRDTSAQSQISQETGCQPGPGAAAFDGDGHLLLVVIKQEFAITHSVAFGVNLAGGGSITPTLRFLRF